jgi:hypothetical protein
MAVCCRCAANKPTNFVYKVHVTIYHAVGVDFKPLAMEMFGATSDIFLKFLKTLAKEAAEIHDIPYSTTFSYWQKRISTTLQKYNAEVLQQSQYKLLEILV